MILRAIPALVAGALLLAGSGVAQAGALSVSPVLLEMSAKRPTRTLEISNPSDQPVNVQLRVFAWAGGGTEEHYAPTQDIGFSPPMFELAPGARQVVRLAARVTPTREMAYRLFVDQIQTAPPEGGISMPVRMALPLFLSPDGGGKTAVAWRIEHDPEGALLVARNAGDRRLRVTELGLESAAGSQSVERGLAGYVLAGQERAWRLKNINNSSRIVVTAVTDQGNIRAEIGPD
ncbi:MAG: molecular chaperone [Alphaproteobacteria bacterium]|nr:molecular chaperone [Alphaproteobacteria bacterium]MBU1517163.1 molecular chaperone [Alphaproteobacteria bacterium]MBU2096504.1 molecular chaperone [Alphaproteobacteria bacterium]MBU2151656.1 molecular chaperone [Alphaproteobacteria bacterium]MBU2305466.1 molecular chaperone [Alphaproteobacteria bacterium]